MKNKLLVELNLKPEFKNKLLSLTTRTDKNHQQPCET